MNVQNTDLGKAEASADAMDLDAIANDLVLQQPPAADEQETKKPAPKPETGTEQEEVSAEVDDEADDEEVDIPDEAGGDEFVDFLEALGEGSNDPDGETPAKDAQDDGSKYRVKVDGEEREVTLSDLIKSYTGEGAIDKRLQDATEARNNVETRVREEMRPVIEQTNSLYQRLAHAYQHYSEAMFAPRYDPPDERLREADPIAYFNQVEDYRQDQDRIRQEQAQVAQLIQQAEAAKREQMQTYFAQQAAALQKKFPGLSNPEAKKAFRDKIVGIATAHGFTPEEVKSAADYRIFTLAAEAAAYRDLKASLASKRQKTTPAKKRPMPTRGDNRPQREAGRKGARMKKAVAKARETGSVDDVAATLIL